MNIIENLKHIADEIMNEEQQFELDEFLRSNRIDLAKEYLLARVDSLYCRSSMDLPTAANYYFMIDPLPERARMFPQIPSKKQTTVRC